MITKISPVASKLAKSSVFCKGLFAVLLIGYAVSFSDTLFHGLAIAPRLLLPPNFWLWTVFTYFLVERNVVILVGDFLCIHLCGAVLEPLWSPLELLTYLLIVNSCVALSSTLFLFSLYFLESSELLFSSTIHGLPGFLGAMLVAVKQIVPDATLLATPMGRVRNSHLPALVFLATLALCVSRVVRWVSLYMVLNGAFFGWIWLRYYQPHQNGNRGDMSDHFSFASFFPSVVQGPIEVVSGMLYGVFLRLGVCQPAIRHFDISQLQSVDVQLPGMEPQDAKRRRDKALRDLKERLNRFKDVSNQPEWPQLETDALLEGPSTHTLISPAVTEDGSATKADVEPEDHFQDTVESPLETPKETNSSSKPQLVLNSSGSETELEGSK